MIALPFGFDPLLTTWIVAGLATACVILRPFGWPEAVWAVLGAAILVLFGLLSWRDAGLGAAKGLDVYLFLTGMMLISELARKEGLFYWLAACSTAHAKGSSFRLFALVYVVGAVVTVFLSNDATAVVLTPAVAAAARTARVRDPLPYLLVCAFIANAASFVLPISNPANLVVFGGGHMPPLAEWLRTFTLPSVAAIGATFLCLYLTQRATLASDTVATDIVRPTLSRCGKVAGAGIAVMAAILIGASAIGADLGLPTLLAGALTCAVVLLLNRESPIALMRGVSWAVLPLVAGLFILVEALDRTGIISSLSAMLKAFAGAAPTETAALAATAVAVASNLVNNLPAGLVAGSAVQAAEVPKTVAAAILIGIDLGPNLSITGSLATILWLSALRREGISVGAWQFLKLGLVVTPPALALALGALIFIG